jgi:hypothetical protein
MVGLRSTWRLWPCALLAGCADDAPVPATPEATSSGATGSADGPAAGSTGFAPSTASGDTTATTSGTGGVPGPDASESGRTDEPVELRLSEVAARIGLDYAHGVIATTPNCLVDAVFTPGGFCIAERMTAGFAAADYDDDGDPDVYVTRTYGGDLLLRNDGDGTFSEVADLGLVHGASSSAVWADFDNDGDADLYVTSLGGLRHFLYINDGAGHFTEDAIARGASVKSPYPHVPYSVALGDYDLDGWLDLYVSEWMSDTGIGKHPSHNRLLHNLGAAAPGHFEDVTDAAGVDLDEVSSEVGAQSGTWGFSPAFADLDGDRWPDLVVVSDFHCSRLFWNDGDGTFTDGTEAAGAGLDHNGMGSTFGDYDLDGDLDWFVTSITHARGERDNRLYRNEGGREFTEWAEPLGMASGGWGWGTTFFDPDNDGDLDLAMAAGYYYTSYMADPNRLWLNLGDGTFSSDVAAEVGFDGVTQARGLLAFDHDLDGDEDLWVANNVDPPEVYRNDSTTPHDWLRVHVRGTTSNRDGIGAWVRVRPTPDAPWQVREIGSASHFLAQQPKTAHFGVGSAAGPLTEVRVYWPVTNTEQVFTDVARNSQLDVQEP